MIRDVYISSCKTDGGIYHYLFENGRFIFKQKTLIDRPMYTAIYKNKLYVILREIDTRAHFGGVMSFDMAGDGRLINPSDVCSTDGIVPCHISVDEKGIFIVNYLSGNIVKLNGKTVFHSGKGVHPTRQEAPHTHFVTTSFDKKYVLCTDLGIDTIFLYDENLNECSSVKLPDGNGPRHLCFSEDGKYLYCVNELSNDVSVFDWNGGKPELKASYPALPDFNGESAAAAIRIKGNYLYISNRGADTISRFEIIDDKLDLLENTYCGGKGPRDFNIIDDYIICTNENSNNVTVLKLENGKPVLTDEKLEIDSCLCVAI